MEPDGLRSHTLPEKGKKQVPFDFAQGRLSTLLRSAQNDR
jgi:hypothetical protein